MTYSIDLRISGSNGKVQTETTNQRRNTDRRKCRVASTTPAGVKPLQAMSTLQPLAVRVNGSTESDQCRVARGGVGA